MKDSDVISNILSAVSLRNFWTRQQVVEFVRRIVERPHSAREARLSDGGYKMDSECLRTLLIFTAHRQQVWLVADQARIYVVTDDRQWEEPQVNASLPLNLAHPVTLEISDRGADGRLQLGAYGGRLQVSMVLFQRVDAKQIIEDFLEDRKS